MNCSLEFFLEKLYGKQFNGLLSSQFKMRPRGNYTRTASFLRRQFQWPIEDGITTFISFNYSSDSKDDHDIIAVEMPKNM